MGAVLAVGLLAVLSADIGGAHGSGCHRWHPCPSDRGTSVGGDTASDPFRLEPAPSHRPAQRLSLASPSVWLPTGRPGAGTDLEIKVGRAQANVIRAQVLLRKLGYDPGPVDGVLGKRTRDAIMRFQASQGIRIDGEVTEDLLRRLVRAVEARQ